MKIKKIYSILALLVIAGVTTGCNSSTTVDSVESTDTATDTTDTSSGPSMDDFIDYVHDDPRAKLTLDYKKEDGSTRNFYEDGIGQVTLKDAIDGDTAHFFVPGVTGEYVKGRFYGIDTPESTGSIENWGHAASEFTKEKLINANLNGTIVISSPAETYQVPEYDTTGVRHLTVVWVNETVKNCDVSELVCLNLWIVQEGYSSAKAVDKIPSLSEVFYDASNQARNYNLKWWSNEWDGWIDQGDYKEISILAIREAEERSKKGLGANPYLDKKVTFEATVMAFADHVLYVQEYFSYDSLETYYEEEVEAGHINEDEKAALLAANPDGKYTGIPVFCGMGAVLSRYKDFNTRLKIKGVVQNERGLQITDINLPASPTSDSKTATTVVGTPSEIEGTFQEAQVFNLDTNQLVKGEETYLYMKVALNQDVYVVGGKNNTKDGSCRLDISLTENGAVLDYSVNLTFQFKPNPDDSMVRWSTYERFLGKKIKVKGVYSYFTYSSGEFSTDYYSISPGINDDIEIVE